MRVTPNTPSIQTLKAQQAWEARRMAKANPPAEQLPQAATAGNVAKTRLETAVEPVPTSTATISPQWGRKVQEIQQIAEKAGFIGVSEQDIRRAYVHGESLLADYRV